MKTEDGANFLSEYRKALTVILCILSCQQLLYILFFLYLYIHYHCCQLKLASW
jgi:hypothetical protein